ncbi:hypothetical protein [Nocardia sp. NPDC050710]|uniref:hypothetical protein n=1 Tax=Nocardia sp. NPDC050710 TaxID=3157220 RepID=UPI0033D773F0
MPARLLKYSPVTLRVMAIRSSAVNSARLPTEDDNFGKERCGAVPGGGHPVLRKQPRQAEILDFSVPFVAVVN